MALIHSEKFAGLALTAQPNDPSRGGETASQTVVFGDHSRYAVYAIHTRFDQIEWVVEDAETIDPATGSYCAIIRQEASCEDALRSMEGAA